MAPYESKVDELYALPLDEFVAGRKRLAGELKQQGSPADAKALLGLAKPTLSAWLTNQTVRRAPALVRELIATTETVAAAQRHGGGDFSSAVAAQRRVVGQLATEARAAAAALGASAEDALARVENNFRWGAVAGAERDALARGRLVRDVAPPGFGGFGGEDAGAIVHFTASSPATARGADAASEADAGAATEVPRTGEGHGSPSKEEAKRDAEAARDQARAAAEAEREHHKQVARHQAELREAEAQVAQARRALTREERAWADADARVAAAEVALTAAREAREAADARRRQAVEAVQTSESAEATLRGAGPPPGGPSVIGGR